ncbi:MAG TPA: hypothetical protein VGB49_05160, partial [Caulobacteraceae bacterium]
LLALAEPPSPAPDGTLRPDPITYEQMVKCAAVFRLASVLARGDREAEQAQAAATSAVAYQHLAYLYGRAQGVDQAAVDDAITASATGQALTYATSIRTPAQRRLAESVMATDRQVCVIVSERVARELGAGSE